MPQHDIGTCSGLDVRRDLLGYPSTAFHFRRVECVVCRHAESFWTHVAKLAGTKAAVPILRMLFHEAKIAYSIMTSSFKINKPISCFNHDC